MKWSYEDVKRTHNALYQAYMDDDVDEETLNDLLDMLWRASKWSEEEYDEVVLTDDPGPGCRLAAERAANA